MRNSLLRLLSAVAAIVWTPSPPATAAAPAVPTLLVDKLEFGQMTNGAPVDLFVLKNGRGLIAKVMSYGAILVELHVPDRQGQPADVVLGFDNLERYLKGHPLFGATVGRYANRIANATFTRNGQIYQLARNNGKNHIHGGPLGFDKKLWRAAPFQTAQAVGVKFSLTSPDGENGFPGNLRVTVSYSLTTNNELRLDYEAATDKDTPVNLSNHSYFNLGGADSGDVLGHVLQIFADRYTPVDEALIPTGEIAPVKDTPLDFTSPTPIGARIAELPKTAGYDHNYVLNSGGKSLDLAARVYEPKSGRVMEVLTTKPGVQLYTANHLKNLAGKRGAVYGKHQGFCLETQYFPDSVNQPHFPSPFLQAGDLYKATTIFRFSTR